MRFGSAIFCVIVHNRFLEAGLSTPPRSIHSLRLVAAANWRVRSFCSTHLPLVDLPTLQALPFYPAFRIESFYQREPTASSCLLPDPTSLRWPCIRRTAQRQWRHRRSQRPLCSLIQHNKTFHKMRRSHCSKSIIVSHLR